MATNYTLNWSDATLKKPFTLLGETINTDDTSLTLTGKASANWGEPLQENLIRILENFASKGLPPLHPTIGQLWYDVNTDKLKIYSINSIWIDAVVLGVAPTTAPTQGPYT